MSTKLPKWWNDLEYTQRRHITQDLQVGKELKDMDAVWRFKHFSDRWAVIRFLESSGMLSERQVQCLITPQRTGQDELYALGKQLYKVGDKSKARILPPVYHRLDRVWMRSNRTGIDPEVMNTGHVGNTLKLLKESHGNIMDKISMTLGAIHTALHNQPELQSEVVHLFMRLEELDVDDMYPVFNALQAEYATRSDLPAEDFVKLHNGNYYDPADFLVPDPDPGNDYGQLDIDFNLKGW